MVNSIARWRKKYTLTLLIFVFGSALSWKLGSSLGEYTAFATLLLGVFGTQDLVDKKVANK
jgi:hypothetical protein